MKTTTTGINDSVASHLFATFSSPAIKFQANCRTSGEDRDSPVPTLITTVTKVLSRLRNQPHGNIIKKEGL